MSATCRLKRHAGMNLSLRRKAIDDARRGNIRRGIRNFARDALPRDEIVVAVLKAKRRGQPAYRPITLCGRVSRAQWRKSQLA